jgi:hypothetical protein
MRVIAGAMLALIFSSSAWANSKLVCSNADQSFLYTFLSRSLDGRPHGGDWSTLKYKGYQAAGDGTTGPVVGLTNIQNVGSKDGFFFYSAVANFAVPENQKEVEVAEFVICQDTEAPKTF